ncbi:MAG: NDP-sugar synthase [Candidatus Eremiobacteraeota bacterium]|nr:NDP-sugar synthase [Candidatus Eremiobacteraeota bacterium]
MILAGGLSTRLYPLTKQVPKPLVPVGGKPNAVHLIHYLKSYGFDEVIINVHYLADAITSTLGDGSKFGVRIEYSHEPELLGSAGGVKQVQRFFGEEEFVVVGCDDLTDLPLDGLLAMHRAKNAIATIGLVERESVHHYGVVVVDANGYIEGFQEKPAPGTERSKLVNTGIYAFSPEIFTKIPSSQFYDFGKQVFPELQETGAAFYGFDARGAYWCDIGTPDEYRRASADLVNGVFAIPDTRASGADASAHVGTGTSVDANVWIGANVRIGNNVRIVGPAVVGDGVTIEDGATLERAIVWEGSSIGAGSILTDTIVGKDYRVEPASKLSSAVVANEAISAPA